MRVGSIVDLQVNSLRYRPRISLGLLDCVVPYTRPRLQTPIFNPQSCRPFSSSSTTFLGLRSPRRLQAPASTIKDGSVSSLAIHAWRRSASNKSKKGRCPSCGERRNKSSVTNGKKPQAPVANEPEATKPAAVTGVAPKAELSPNPPFDAKAATGSEQSTASSQNAPVGSEKATQDPSSHKSILGHIPETLSHLHRPTKEELLAAATGFWQRLHVRFKWLTIRSARPFNIDEIGAFFSWILLGQFVWLILGTTTFVSLVIWGVNTVFAQETLAQWIGNYLTKSSGITVIFESAVVPKWKDNVISFKNVLVSRRPGQAQSKVRKGAHPASVAAAAAAAERVPQTASGEEDTNYTQFDVTIDTVNVTLSFVKWWNGKGLLKDVEIKGIRGVIDRTSVRNPTEYVDPRTYKHEHNPGDFELDSFKMEDLLVTIYQPGGFRPFPVSIYSCDLPQLRKQWLFYDFLSANMVSGSFDNSLFTIHPRQTHNYTGARLIQGVEEDGPAQWKKQSRIRIDALNIDHLNRGIEGPFGWIHEGNVDIVADIMFPSDEDGSIAKVMSDFYDRMEATVTSNGLLPVAQPDINSTEIINEDPDQQDETTKQPVQAMLAPLPKDEDNRFLIMDLRVHLNDVRAAVPLFTKDISYVNNALVRPIVAYINSKKAFIPVNCRVVKRANEFDGSWTIYDSGLMEDLSREMYEAFARDVLNDHQSRNRRLKKVGFWTLQLAAQALFVGLAGNIA